MKCALFSVSMPLRFGRVERLKERGHLGSEELQFQRVTLEVLRGELSSSDCSEGQVCSTLSKCPI